MLKADLEKLVKKQAAEIVKLKDKIADLESGVVEVEIDPDAVSVSTPKPRAVDRR
jgi:hypothetical protein